MEETAVVESSSQESTSSPESSASSNDASFAPNDSDIQDIMSSAWLDDGLGSVVDKNGAEIINSKTGQPFKTIEELKQAVAQKPVQPTAPTQQGQKQQAQTQKPLEQSGMQNFFKDGQIDYSSVSGVQSKFKGLSYSSQLYPKEPQQAPVASINQSTDGITPEYFKEIDDLRETLSKAYLEPLQAIAKTVDQNSETWNILNQQYRQYQTQIDATVKTKERELIAKSSQESSSKIKQEYELNHIKQSAESNVKTISNEIFGNGGDKAFWELIVGKTNPTTGQLVERGVAADLVDLMFDTSMSGKTFKSQEDYSKAYQNWFANFASSPNNVRLLARQAYATWIANNLDSIKSGAKQAGEKISSTRKALAQPRPIGNAQPAQQEQNQSPSIKELWGL